MFRKRARLTGVGLLCLVFTGVYLWAADVPSGQEKRDKAQKAFKDGNYRDAYDALRALALDPKDDPAKVGNDLTTAIQSLNSLGRVDEIDDFREGVIAAHPKNWRLLQTAAQSFVSNMWYGYVVAGKFHRGYKRGGGKWVNTTHRDRARALQLMQQAMPLAGKDANKGEVASFHLAFAGLLLNGTHGHQAWRLQYLTDLTKLPDYEAGYWYGGNARGAPVDADGQPIYYHVPKSYEAAANDGERWRWMLMQAVELDPSRVNETDMSLAAFCKSQFGVQTMADRMRGRQADAGGPKKTGTFELHTLKDTETIAKLATGLKRFTVPDEFNWIVIYERVAKRGKSSFGETGRDYLAQVYEDRRQYVKAATAWKKAIAEYGVGTHRHRQARLDQIVANWGRFEPINTQPGGTRAVVDYRFRNGKKVEFTAHAVKVDKLLADARAYIKNRPNGGVDWQQTNISNIGFRLVHNNETAYVGDKVANWTIDVKPRPEHVDDRVTVSTPLDKPGAYLVTATMEGGNVSRIIVWVADTVLVKKALDGKAYYFVADTVTGQPIDKANVEFFGWKMVYEQNGRSWRNETKDFARNTDADGQIVLGPADQPNQMSWLITARKPKAGLNGTDRLAYLGFTNVWFGRPYDQEYNAARVFTITDRPVYRPEHKIQFKSWIRHAKYDMADTPDEFANKDFSVVVLNPKGDKVFEKTLRSDAYGGVEGELNLPRDATLGVYHIQIVGHGGSSTFRLEEYKKPEFEVKVEAPKDPVRLGDKIEATIQAKYYFGAPVTNAKVKYKVVRTRHDETWYPAGAWDWFYGTGYWWFTADYDWFPGFRMWGCKAPIQRWWWGFRNQEPPEVVLENEVEIGQDGIVKVTIDTAATKELHGDQDHSFAITAEVVDQSRRTIVGTGNVIASREPFKVFSWVDRGYYRPGDVVKASFRGMTPDKKPVQGHGTLTLYSIGYKKGKPVETAVQEWEVETDAQGYAKQSINAKKAGQYRLSYKLTDAKKHTIEGGYVFVVRGEGVVGNDFRFNGLELVTDKREYAPGEKVKLMVNTDTIDGTVLLFLRPTNGVYLPPKVLRLKGKSTVEEVAVVQRDMPNFFIEAMTVHGGKVYQESREVVVPPEKRVLNVQVLPDAQEYKPGQKATVKVKVTDFFGKPFAGSTVLSVYDRSVEYISGGSNVPEIRAFFWKWRRSHYPQNENSLARGSANLLKQNQTGMSDLGIFGNSVVDEFGAKQDGANGIGLGGGFGGGRGEGRAKGAAAPGASRGLLDSDASDKDRKKSAEPMQAAAEQAEGGQPGKPGVEPTVRKNFADTAFWKGRLETDKDGVAEVSFTMPEQLTGWKVKVWALGQGTRVGQGEAEVVTKKNLLVRLQAPRFFTQTDEVVLSANVHNYLKAEKSVAVSLETEGGVLQVIGGQAKQDVKIAAGGERRVDWRVKVTGEGVATVRMKAVTDEESDAMQTSFPAHVHGMLKMESFSGVIRPDAKEGRVALTVPKERRAPLTRLEVQYSPTLAGAMVDALPYLVEYPHGCTEQTLNRFLPTVVTMRTLQRMKVDLADVQKKRTNLNAAELGDAKGRAAQWKRYDRNPVFDEAEVKRMTVAGVTALTNMQCGDGGWGWFSGWGEHSWPHTTAVVVHGLQIARENDVALPPNVLERGVAWLEAYQAGEVQKIKNAPAKLVPWKEHADDLDAMVYMVLRDAGKGNDDMREFLYRDRTKLSVHAKAMFGLALHAEKQQKKLDMILENIAQFVVEDDENQTAYLKLPAGNRWWAWYGSDIEADAYYLKLLSRTSPKDPKAAGLVKFLLANRKHATYWRSTRDTATCVEAMADYIRASGEDRPDMTVEVWLDGKKRKEVKIDAKNLFSFDNRLMLEGDAVTDGAHTVEIRRRGTGPVYFNAYLTNFTLEEFITRAGLEVKVNRKYYKLERIADAKEKVPGSRGQAAEQRVEKYKRVELPSGSMLKSGDLVEVELEVDSKNDYEYLLFEDPKAAGFEALAVRSGYDGNDLGAYMEVRDDRICFFVRRLALGKHSVSYRLRAEIPGKFSALPAKASAMYAPELKGNSDEMKVSVKD